jgi:hypothetical protein
LFGLAAKWKKSRPDRLGQLARAIEAISEQDRRQVDESVRVERLRVCGAEELHAICRGFAQALNERLPRPALLLDPGEFSADHYASGAPGLFQLNLRGRLLQIEFQPTEELSSSEDFRRPYVLYGTVRSFNQDFLDRHTVDERAIFYCLEGSHGRWHYFDSRTYRTGPLTQEFFASELERLL